MPVTPHQLFAGLVCLCHPGANKPAVYAAVAKMSRATVQKALTRIWVKPKRRIS